MSKIRPDQIDDFKIKSNMWGIFIVSMLGLLLETLFIRWIGSEIRIFAYLQNTILVVCFLGIGLGAFTSSKPIDLRQSLIPLIILLTLMAIPPLRVLFGLLSDMLNITGDLIIWKFISFSADNPLLLFIFGLILTYTLLILLVDIFVPLGRILGRLLNDHPKPILAYSVNIVGSILGTWLFVLLSYFYAPPFVWFVFVGILFALLIISGSTNWKINLALAGIAVGLAWFANQPENIDTTTWSPYQKLSIRSLGDGEYNINVNGIYYQSILDLSDAHVRENPSKFPPESNGFSQYDIPLLLHPDPEKFLIVGAGSGNDAAGGIRHSVESIIAVEIDPAIISFGRTLHPEHPYSFANVQVVNDDARSFFSTTNQKFDVISFGLLDSHTTTSMTNARLDHYVYTQESIEQAKALLNEGGIITLTFEAQKPYINDRMDEVLRAVFKQKPLVFRIPPSNYGVGGVMFVVGDQNNIKTQLAKNPSLSETIHEWQLTYPIELPHQTKIASDNWPYIYLETPKIPSLYYLFIGLMAVIFLRSYKKWQATGNVSRVNLSFLHFFFLGAAFLLLEVQNISKASVALGNTWQVNAIIISSILAMALMANLIASKYPKISLKPIYAALIATCIFLYFIDLSRFAPLPYITKAIVVGTLTSLPMLFSGMVFIRSFAMSREKNNALGANLIGAVAGALLQSVTFIWGIKVLLLIVIVFYLIAMATTLKEDKAIKEAYERQ